MVRSLMLQMLQLSARRAPAFPVLANPVEQRALKADVVSEPLGFQPFVFQNLLPLREEFLVEAGLFDELAGRWRLLSWLSHAARQK